LEVGVCRNVKAGVISIAVMALLAGACHLEEIPPEAPDEPPTNALEVPPPDPVELETPEAPFPEPDRPPPAEPPPPAGPDPVVEATVLEVDERFWAGPGTRGAELVGAFVTPEAMLATLALDAPVLHHEGRDWALADLLVGAEFRGPGARATWWVAGPPAVIDAYVARLQEEAQRSGALLELGVLPLEVRRCCDGEATLTLQ
jgi:hypothetical protein